MIQLYILYCSVFAFSSIMGILIIPRIISISQEKKLAEKPSLRDVHHTPTPRLGGIAFVPIAIMALFAFNCMCIGVLGIEVMPKDSRMFMRIQAYGIGVMLLYLVGVADDLVSVNFKAKFLAQIVAGAIIAAAGLYLHSDMGIFGLPELPKWIGIPVSIFLVVYITNAINLIDGVDGLASGICILTFSFYALLFANLNLPFLICLCLAILGVLIVFFVFNVFGGEGHKFQKLFMGDTGSLTMGYTISFLILILSEYIGKRTFIVTGAMYAAFAPLVIPMLDVIRVVMSRYRDRVPLFLPDKRHIHHKLLRAGLSARMTMVTLLFMTIGFILLNVILPQFLSSPWVVLANVFVWCGMHLIINHFIHKTEAKNPMIKEKYTNQKNTIDKANHWKL